MSAADAGPGTLTSPDPATPPIREAGPLTEEVVEGAGEVTPLDKHQLRDLHQLAKQRGEDVEELKHRHRGTSDFNAVVHRYEFRYQDIWVEAVVGPLGGRGDNHVVFTKRPPAKVFADLKALGTDTVVVWGAPGTARELRRLSKAVMLSLTAHRGVFSYAGTGTRRLGEAVTVSYALDPTASPQPSREQIDMWKAEALAAGAARFADGRMPTAVEFVELERGTVIRG